MQDFGRLLVLLGLGIAVLGGALWAGSRLAGLGHLPGDFVLRRGPLTVYFPLASSILLSLILTLLVNLLWRR